MKTRAWLVIFFICFFTIPAVLALVRKDQILSKEIVDARHISQASNFTTINESQVHYVERGNPNGPALLMIHGLGGFSYNFNLLMDSLGEDYRLIALDLPGFGMSDFPEISDTTDVKLMYRRFILDFLDSTGVDSFHLAGNSMGGWISWELAAHIPARVKSLTLLASAGLDIAEIRDKLIGVLTNPVIRFGAKKGIPPRLKTIALSRLFYDHKYIRDGRADAWVDFMNREGTIETFFKFAEISVVTDTNQLKELTMPTLVVWGQNDKIVPPEHAKRFERLLPNDSLVVFPKCGHAPMIEYSGICAELIRNLMKGHSFAPEDSIYYEDVAFAQL